VSVVSHCFPDSITTTQQTCCHLVADLLATLSWHVNIVRRVANKFATSWQLSHLRGNVSGGFWTLLNIDVCDVMLLGRSGVTDTDAVKCVQDIVVFHSHYSSLCLTCDVIMLSFTVIIPRCILLDRSGVTDSEAVERVQDIYTETLIEYVKNRRVDSSRFLAKLLMKLVDLRTVNAIHTEFIYQMTISKGSLPPLLQEYFDIPYRD